MDAESNKTIEAVRAAFAQEPEKGEAIVAALTAMAERIEKLDYALRSAKSKGTRPQSIV